MAKLEATYVNPQRSIYTDLESHGSTLLGAVESATSRATVATSVMQSVSVTPQVIDVTMKDGSKFYAYGKFNTNLNTTSFSDFFNQVEGVINQIVEIEVAGPNSPRYTLSDVAISVKDYFSTATWEDVLDGVDTLIGGVGGDDLIGYGSDSVYNGMGGDDGLLALINEGNLAIYRGKLSDYQISLSQSINIGEHHGLAGLIVQDRQTNRDGTDTVANIDRLQFYDLNLALDTAEGEIAGQAYRIYKAAFDRMPDQGGLGFWIDSMDDGASLLSVARGFINSAEFQSVYGANVSDRDYVTRLYNNVLDRNPDQGGYDYWLGALTRGASREDILVSFSESAENIANVAALIANGIQYEAWIS